MYLNIAPRPLSSWVTGQLPPLTDLSQGYKGLKVCIEVILNFQFLG